MTQIIAEIKILYGHKSGPAVTNATGPVSKAMQPRSLAMMKKYWFISVIK